MYRPRGLSPRSVSSDLMKCHEDGYHFPQLQLISSNCLDLSWRNISSLFCIRFVSLLAEQIVLFLTRSQSLTTPLVKGLSELRGTSDAGATSSSYLFWSHSWSLKGLLWLPVQTVFCSWDMPILFRSSWPLLASRRSHRHKICLSSVNVR